MFLVGTVLLPAQRPVTRECERRGYHVTMLHTAHGTCRYNLCSQSESEGRAIQYRAHELSQETRARATGKISIFVLTGVCVPQNSEASYTHPGAEIGTYVLCRTRRTYYYRSLYQTPCKTHPPPQPGFRRQTGHAHCDGGAAAGAGDAAAVAAAAATAGAAAAAPVAPPRALCSSVACSLWRRLHSRQPTTLLALLAGTGLGGSMPSAETSARSSVYVASWFKASATVTETVTTPLCFRRARPNSLTSWWHSKAASSSAEECTSGSMMQSSAGKENDVPSWQRIATWPSLLSICKTSLDVGQMKCSFISLHSRDITDLTSPKSTT